MSIGKIVGLVTKSLSSSKAVQNACRTGAKYFKTAPVTTQNIAGQALKTNHMTGTQFAKLADGTKTVVLGSGNRLSKVLGEGTSIVSYPKGSFFGGKTGLIRLAGKDASNPIGALSFTPKEYGDFEKLMKDLNKIYA